MNNVFSNPLALHRWPIRPHELPEVSQYTHRKEPILVARISFRSRLEAMVAIVELSADSRRILVSARPNAPSAPIPFSQIIRIHTTSPISASAEWIEKEVTIKVHLDTGGTEIHRDITAIYRDPLGLFLLRPATPSSIGAQFFYPQEILKDVVIAERSGATHSALEVLCSNSSELSSMLEFMGQRKTKKLGEVLVALGLLSVAQINAALAAQSADPGIRLGDWLLKMGWLSRDGLQKGILQQLGYVVVDVEKFTAAPELLTKFSFREALATGALPLCRIPGGVAIVIDNPLEFVLQNRLQSHFGDGINYVIPVHHSVNFLIKRFYANLDLAD